MKISLNINTKLFNEAYLPLLHTDYDYEIYFGGGGSGKSRFVAQKKLLRCLQQSYYRLMYCRKVADTIRYSQFQLFKDLIQEWKLNDYFQVKESTMEIICVNGNSMLARGLDDIEKVKSIEGITDIWVEEATEITENDFDALDIRIRTLKGPLRYTLTFNPVDENHWIKKRFCPEESEGIQHYTYTVTAFNDVINENISLTYSLLHTTYQDNRFLPIKYVAKLEALSKTNPNYYRVYKLGKWGKTEVKRPYCYNFDEKKHVSKEAVFSIHKRVYLSLDFNVEPFVCTARHQWFDKEGHHWHVFKQFVLEKDGDVYRMAQAIKDYFPRETLTSLIITGDAMQKKREITQVNNLDGWKIICKELGISTSSSRFQVPKSNPSVKNNRFLVGAVHSIHPDYKIHPDCTLLINEMQFTEADEEGDIIKTSRKNENQRADALDTERYAINSWMFDFIDHPKKYGVK